MAQTVNKKKAKKYSSPASRKKIDKSGGADGQKYLLGLFAILVISFIIYMPALQNKFVWDDEIYIQHNPLIRSINLKDIFSEFVVGNYHPLTILTYAMEYHYFGLSEKGYHSVNLALHLANIILVYYVVLMLSKKEGVALMAALLFGIHPLHVESVVWASQLKDLLYSLFFLGSYLCYLKYIRNGKRKLYFYCLLLFLLSLLSKAMAVSLPVVFLLTDYFFPHLRTGSVLQPQAASGLISKGMHSKLWMEKIPFFILAIIFGIVSIIAQKSAGATEVLAFPFPIRIVFACYAFIIYLAKLVVPVHLSVFYGYPVKMGDTIPSSYYIYLLLFAVLVAGVFYSYRFSKKTVFGLGFFAVTVFLVLQLLPVGNAVIADRYSYIPSIGIFYLAGEGIYWLWNNKKFNMSKIVSIVLLTVITVFYSVRTYARCAVFKNGLALWNDVISETQTQGIAYYNRAVMLKDEGRMDEAFADFNKTIELLPKHAPGAYNDRGIILAMRGRYEEAIKDFTIAIELDPTNPEAYLNMAISLQHLKRFEEAVKDYSKAIEFNPASSQAFYNRAVIEYDAGQKEAACADFKQAAQFGFPGADKAYSDLCH